MNLAFVANLFNIHPRLAPLDEEKARDYPAIDELDAEGKHEARIFTLWLNSLGIDPTFFKLFENLKDRLIIILQMFDKIMPSGVAWRGMLKPKASISSVVQPMFSEAGEGEEKEDIGITPNQS